MRDIARVAIESVFLQLDPHRTNNTFEVFGLDFMIDTEFKVSLIEINTNPDLEICCTLLQRLIPSMLDNTFKIVLDPVFVPPDIIQAKKQKLYGIDSVFANNKYSLIFDEQVEKERLTNVFKNSVKQGNYLFIFIYLYFILLITFINSIFINDQI